MSLDMKFIFLLTGKVSALEPELGLARNKTTSNQSKNMNKMYKAAILAALGLASVTAAQAQTASTTYNKDLLVGFTTGTGTDLVYDLGSAANVLNGTLTSWTLTDGFTAASLTNGLASVEWGVIGGVGPANGGSSLNGQRFVYTTAQTTPAVTISGKTTWGNDLSGIGNIYGGFPAAGAGQFETIIASDSSNNSWYEQTTLAGAGDNTTAYIKDIGQDPNSTGLVSADLYAIAADNSAPTDLGTFTLNADNTLTFAVNPVPEPTTTGLVAAGGGLLMLVRRNKFSRK